MDVQAKPKSMYPKSLNLWEIVKLKVKLYESTFSTILVWWSTANDFESDFENIKVQLGQLQVDSSKKRQKFAVISPKINSFH